MSDIRVRFAPSPTGHVHIGNIRAAIFNWLFARNQGGKFLLRVEDTDKERSTQAAIDSLLECMDWLGLDFDEEAFYQSSQAEHHIATANKLIDEGHAYRAKKGDGGEVTLFRMPWINEDVPFLKKLGNAEQALHPEQSVTIDYTGMTFLPCFQEKVKLFHKRTSVSQVSAIFKSSMLTATSSSKSKKKSTASSAAKNLSHSITLQK